MIEFDSNDCFQQLSRANDNLSLENTLCRLWRRNVPKVFSSTAPDMVKKHVQKLFLSPLEEYLTDSKSPSTVFKSLKEKDDPPVFCAKAFRNGDPTYSCRDCAVDPTCVLCMQCFDRSVHKKHKYKISTSSGGGYCDCGDVDAWKSDPACSEHNKAQQSSSQNPEDRLPTVIRRRAELLFDQILHHCYKMLTWAECSSPPPKLIDPEDADLKKDIYYTMLLNDEVHTYDQVIGTLIKAIDPCTKREATEFATIVDREGRACVYKGPKNVCDKIAKTIKTKTGKHSSKALQVKVMHYTVVAHQEFALNLLKWLETIICRSDALRSVFCRVTMEKIVSDTNHTLLEDILLADTIFWKAVRLQYHQLFMSGVFKDLAHKTQYAILFTKHYKEIYDEFVKDDHYRSVSATAVTVQIYTVTTIARILIAKHELIEAILRTILHQCSQWCEGSENEVMNFARHQPTEKYTIFKRSQYALYDLKYALSTALPGLEWTDELRCAFLSGFKMFIRLLSHIQGMDASKRFTAQHIEFEAEWETAFNLQLKIHDCISLMIKWCASDEEVLLEAYRIVLQSLPSSCKCPTVDVTISGTQASCCSFEVGGTDKFTSIHLPLHRMLGGLSTHLPKDINYLSPIFKPLNSRLSLPGLLESSLRVQVLIAQVQADMWKRNGYSILNQIYYYQNVKCRQEMYDRDIQLIQAIASLMDPNAFMVHVLHKFGLTNVFSEMQDLGSTTLSQKQISVLLDECLHLFIVLLGERYVEGIGQVDSNVIVQREIIHLLAINRMSHSDLEKNLVEDHNHETLLEANVGKVAEFNRKETGKGMYSLMKECRESFNPCFYHYNKSEQSKAEDYQRTLRKNDRLSQALPVPIMPSWKPRYQSISRLFTCDVMLHVVRTVLCHMVSKKSRVKSESHLEKVLHLITMGLHDDKLNYTAGDRRLSFCQAMKTAGNVDGTSVSVLELLNQCSTNESLTHIPIKDLMMYVIEYYQVVSSLDSALDIPKVTSTSSLDAMQAADKEKAKRAAKAAKTRQKLLERMAKAQQKFKTENAKLFENCTEQALGRSPSAMDISDGLPEKKPENPIALGLNKTEAHKPSEDYVCIVCQEASNITKGGAVVYSAFVQRSTVLSRNRITPTCHPSKSSLYVHSDVRSGSFTSTCGHPMHAQCWKGYYESVKAREQRSHRGLFPLQHKAFNTEMNEFLCPLCDSIANTVLPVLPNLTHTKVERPVESQPSAQAMCSLSEWLVALTQLIRPDVNMDESCPLPDLAKHAADAVNATFRDIYEFLSIAADDSLITEEMSSMIIKFLLTHLVVYRNEKPSQFTMKSLDDPDIPSLVWNSTAYTIMVTEQLLRSDGKPLFGHLTQRQESCISLLVRFSSVFYKVLSNDSIHQHCRQLLTDLFCPLFTEAAAPSSIVGSGTGSTCLLDLDIWHLTVSLCFSMPSLLPSSSASIPAGGVNEQYLLHVMLALHMTQALTIYSHCEQPKTETAPVAEIEDTSMEVDDEEGTCLIEVYEKIQCCFKKNISTSNLDESELESYVINACLPFLRCAAILFRNLTDVLEPPALHDINECGEEYSIICRYLALPEKPSGIFTSDILQLVLQHCKIFHLNKLMYPSRYKAPQVEYPLSVNQLVQLPEDYSDLINSASRFTCPNSTADDESRSPVLCLICNAMLCSQSYCCQVEVGNRETIGAASAHAQSCAAGNGIFLRIRQCQIVLLSGHTKGCFLAAPYVDDYGETDIHLRRGNPLHLSHSAYKDLHRLWLSHGLAELVSRNIGYSHHLMPEWFNL